MMRSALIIAMFLAICLSSSNAQKLRATMPPELVGECGTRTLRLVGAAACSMLGAMAIRAGRQ